MESRERKRTSSWNYSSIFFSSTSLAFAVLFFFVSSTNLIYSSTCWSFSFLFFFQRGAHNHQHKKEKSSLSGASQPFEEPHFQN